MVGGRTVTPFSQKLAVTDSHISGSRFEQQTASVRIQSLLSITKSSISGMHGIQLLNHLFVRMSPNTWRISLDNSSRLCHFHLTWRVTIKSFDTKHMQGFLEELREKHSNMLAFCMSNLHGLFGPVGLSPAQAFDRGFIWFTWVFSSSLSISGFYFHSFFRFLFSFSYLF